MRELKIMAFMVKNPGWHFGLDLVAERLASRFFVYAALGALEELGLVERRNDPNHAHPGLPRVQFRSLVTLTARETGAELKTALFKYGRHSPTCQIYARSNPDECSCGFQEAKYPRQEMCVRKPDECEKNEGYGCECSAASGGSEHG